MAMAILQLWAVYTVGAGCIGAAGQKDLIGLPLAYAPRGGCLGRLVREI
jgi:hypothetical protein